VNTAERIFRINVGFLINQPIGYTRDIPIELAHQVFDENLTVDDLKGNLNISRTQSGLRVQAIFKAVTNAECVRCLEVFQLPLETTFEEIFTYEHNPLSEEELIIPEDGNIDFEPYVRDYLLLEVPINPICKSDCRGLCDICGENLNFRDCGHEHDEPLANMAEAIQSIEGKFYPGKNTPIKE
jgi:uncharacterized protein